MSEKKFTCRCKWCKRSRRIWGLVKKYNMSISDKELINDILNTECNLSESNDYWRAVMEGGWPQGKEILIHALKRYGVTIKIVEDKSVSKS